MKIKTSLLVFFALTMALSCRKGSKSKPEIEKLPPITQTGAGTFGCLVNGTAFFPKGPSLQAILSSYYEKIYPGDAGYVFQVAAADKSKTNREFYISVGCDSVSFSASKTFALTEPVRYSSAGLYTDAGIDGNMTYRNNYSTSQTVRGELKISLFDSASQIVAGTFWFDAVDDNGKKVEIREGRFDMHYTR